MSKSRGLQNSLLSSIVMGITASSIEEKSSSAGVAVVEIAERDVLKSVFSPAVDVTRTVLKYIVDY